MTDVFRPNMGASSPKSEGAPVITHIETNIWISIRTAKCRYCYSSFSAAEHTDSGFIISEEDSGSKLNMVTLQGKEPLSHLLRGQLW